MAQWLCHHWLMGCKVLGLHLGTGSNLPPSFLPSFLPSILPSFLPSILPSFLPYFFTGYWVHISVLALTSLPPSFLPSFPSFLPSILPPFLSSLFFHWVLGSHLSTIFNPERVFKGPIGRRKATTPSSLSLTSKRVTTNY